MTADRAPLADRARGRWRGILGALGIDSSYLNGKHGPCPICRAGTDRFRFDDKDGRGTWVCSQCEGKGFCASGNGVELVKRVLKVEFKEAAERIEAVIGGAPRQQPRRERTDADKLADARRMWRDGQKVTKGDPVETWLFSRLGQIDVPPSLKFMPTLRYFGESVSYHPGMVAVIQSADGKLANVHRTFLTPDGLKAAVPEPRMVMPGDHPKGSAVRLAPAAPLMGVGTGIETSLAASLIFEVPTWATLTDGRLEEFEPPGGVTELLIFGDNDMSFSGQAAAYRLAKRMTVKGIRTRVEIPLIGGRDWNDEWNAKRREGRAA